MIILIYPYWNVDFYKRFLEQLNSRILIYPYWNVDFGDNVVNDAGTIYFNLSILECRLCQLGYNILKKFILIYPYWNVDIVRQLLWKGPV